MKKALLFFTLIYCVGGTVIGQDKAPSYDSTFRRLYEAVALHPGYMNSQWIVNDSVVKRWDRDIRILVSGSKSKARKELIAKLKNTIAILSPALNKKVQITFTDDKASANYLVNLVVKGRSGWHIKWDGQFNIYSCIVLLNTSEIFNSDQQAEALSHYLLQSLGDFVFNYKDRKTLIKNDPSVASNVSAWRKEINDIDLRILQVHYSDDIKPGMSRKDIDQFFDRQNN